MRVGVIGTGDVGDTLANGFLAHGHSVMRGSIVKAFSCVANALMVDPRLPGGRPTMFVCGNDAATEEEPS